MENVAARDWDLAIPSIIEWLEMDETLKFI